MMKRKNLIYIPALLLLTFWGCTDEVQQVTTLNSLVMADEFDVDGTPNSSMWRYNVGRGVNGWGNNELQYYTALSQNVKVEDGMLHIIAREEDYNGAQYTSARLLTEGLFEKEYGRIEARIKLPWGKGIWPAFWMLGEDCSTIGWPDCGEIDIMEFRGQAPTIIYGSVHGPGYSGGEAITKSYELKNDRFDTDFHIFGIEWGRDYINYYVDDVLYNQITPEDVSGEWVFNKPFYLIMNVAVGGDFVGGPPNSETEFPQSMLVDYVRIYE